MRVQTPGGSGASSSSSTDRAGKGLEREIENKPKILGSYIIDQRRNNEHSLCGSEPYTDSGIEKADSNNLEEEQRFLRDDECDLKLIAGTTSHQFNSI